MMMGPALVVAEARSAATAAWCEAAAEEPGADGSWGCWAAGWGVVRPRAAVPGEAGAAATARLPGRPA